ncbi:MAG: hypothetical protein DRH20_04065 [Deltaproteobacteria bacterium]|nr:MAG: hypothetical protein DRH20_04065 [Deltaproteobacteria bacterium]
MERSMDVQVWIFSQVMIDAVMFGLILLLLRVQRKNRVSMDEVKTTHEKTRQLLGEMREIGSVLEKNLEEKRRLTRSLFEELDRRTAEARRHIQEYRKIHRDLEAPRRAEAPSNSGRRLGERARGLMDKGMSLREAARHLDVPSGELELLLKLQDGKQEG